MATEQQRRRRRRRTCGHTQHTWYVLQCDRARAHSDAKREADVPERASMLSAGSPAIMWECAPRALLLVR